MSEQELPANPSIHSEQKEDQAEAKMAEVNRLLEQLAQTGWVQETVILGPVIHQRYYVPLSGGHDSSQVVQAALCLSGGLGLVLWDSDDSLRAL